MLSAAIIKKSCDRKFVTSDPFSPVYTHCIGLFKTKQLLKNTKITEMLLKRADLPRQLEHKKYDRFSIPRQTTAVSIGRVVCFELFMILTIS